MKVKRVAGTALNVKKMESNMNKKEPKYNKGDRVLISKYLEFTSKCEILEVRKYSFFWWSWFEYRCLESWGGAVNHFYVVGEDKIIKKL